MTSTDTTVIDLFGDDSTPPVKPQTVASTTPVEEAEVLDLFGDVGSVASDITKPESEYEPVSVHEDEVFDLFAGDAAPAPSVVAESRRERRAKERAAAVETSAGVTTPAPVSDVEEPVWERTWGGAWKILAHTGGTAIAGWVCLALGLTVLVMNSAQLSRSTAAPLLVLAACVGVVAAVDRKTHLIKNEHTIVAAVLSVSATVATSLYQGHPERLIWAAVGAAAVFVVFLILVFATGFGSGGDIKFSPVAGFVFGAFSPLLSLIWLLAAFLITLVLMLVSRKKDGVAFGSGMAVAVPITVAALSFVPSLVI